LKYTQDFVEIVVQAVDRHVVEDIPVPADFVG
jgi:hypothetical protein